MAYRVGSPQKMNLVSRETTNVNGSQYDVIALREYMSTLPIQEIMLHHLSHIVNKEHDYWLSEDGSNLGPYKIMKNWDQAKQNPLWSKHINSIQNANLSLPIWIFRKEGEQDFVFDGIHRLTNAFLNNEKKIKCIVVTSLPEWAIVK